MLIFQYLIYIQLYFSLPKSPSTKPNNTPSAKTSSYQNTLLYLVNKLRSKAGVKALTLDKTLSQVALQHSKDQFAQGKMTHSGSDKSSVRQRADRAGYKWKSIGENVARNQKNEYEVTQAWWDSPGHRKNMMNGKFANVGFGYYRGYWTEVLGTK